jgi:hypothetical protein
MIRWIPDELADSYVCDITRGRRDTRDQRRALEMLDYIASVLSIEHFGWESARGVQVSAMHVWHRHYIFCCVYATMRENVVKQFDALNVLFVITFGITFHQAPSFDFSRSVYHNTWFSHEVRV